MTLPNNVSHFHFNKRKNNNYPFTVNTAFFFLTAYVLRRLQARRGQVPQRLYEVQRVSKQMSGRRTDPQTTGCQPPRVNRQLTVTLTAFATFYPTLKRIDKNLTHLFPTHSLCYYFLLLLFLLRAPYSAPRV